MIRSAGRRVAATAAALLLAACASAPPPRMDGTEVLPRTSWSGRLSVRIETEPVRAWHASFDLQGGAREGELRLSTPLGTTLAVARWNPFITTLERDGETRRYPDLDSLTREVMGEPVPVAALFDWMQGRPWAGAPIQTDTTPPQAPPPAPPQTSQQTLQPTPQNGVFEQIDWRVDTSRAREGMLTARRNASPPVTLRVLLDR